MTNHNCDESFMNGNINVICQNCKIRHHCFLKIIYEQNSHLFENLVKNKIPLKKGNRLVHKGNPFKAIFMVFNGSLKSYITSPSGKEQITRIFWPGDLIGLDVIYQKQYSQSVKALENSSVIEIPYSKLMSLYKISPEIQSKLFQLMHQEMTYSQEMTALLRTKSAEARYAAYLLSISERFRQFAMNSDSFVLTMSRSDIANYLQMATETISRVSTQFQRDNWIEVQRNRVTLCQKAPLQKLASIVMPKFSESKVVNETFQTHKK